MLDFNEKYVTDENGDRIGALLDMGIYHKLLEALEKLAALRAYDAAKEADDEIIPFEQAIAEIQLVGL